MGKIVKYFWIFLFATMLVCNIACKKEEFEEPEEYGIVKGIVTSNIINERQGFKVSLTETNSKQPIQVIVTEEDGSFCFSNVAAGTYKVDVKNEKFYCIQVTVDNTIINSNYAGEFEIQVEANQIVAVDIQMQPYSSYINDGLKITDANGNTIENRITIQKYTPIITMRLYNKTTEYMQLNITRWQLCYLEGARDTVIDGHSGFTGLGTYQIFSDFSSSSETISPGENALITGTINQEIYTLDYFRRDNSYLSIYANSRAHSYSKGIDLYFPFVIISDMSEWHDKK